MSIKTVSQEIYKTPKIIFIEWISVIGVFIICFFFLFNEMRRIENKLGEEIKQNAIKIDQQSSRTDRLYEMFIDLLKENRSAKPDSTIQER